MNSQRTGRRYDREFKQNTVALLRSGRIGQSFEQSRRTYGSPRGQRDLREVGRRADHHDLPARRTSSATTGGPQGRGQQRNSG